ncbi:ABC transporter substrate-binding protein [Paenibacillus solisilvae]|uniref:ABC transporter substrate-binding protein n=1 Tax=Paenibacillus solisilvae TaxID=2486751 RepID=A0ABW0VQG3_9BACL
MRGLISMKKKSPVIVTILTGSLLLTACSSGNDTASSPQNTNSNTSTSSTKTASINVDYMASGSYDKAAEELAGKLKANGINATVAAFPYADLRQKNTNDLISGTGNYDVMSGSYYLADVYSYFNSLKSYIDKDQYGTGLVDGLMQKSEFMDGEQIGIPYGADAYGIMYRTDLFEEAGLTVPKTWEEFNSDIAILKSKYEKNGIAPYVFAGGATEQLPGPFMARYSGAFIGKDDKYHLDEAKAVSALKDTQATQQSGQKNMTSLSIDQANALFIDGKVAVMEGWPSFIRVTADDPTKSKIVGKWAVAPYPNTGTVWLSLWQMYMPKTSKNKEAAWNWMKSYASEENDKVYFEKYGISPIYKSTYEDQDLVKKYSYYMTGVMENLKMAKNPPLSGEAQDFMASTFGDVFSGKITAEEGIANINTKWATLPVPAPLLESAKRNGQTE